MSQTHSLITILLGGDIDFSHTHTLFRKLSSLCVEDKMVRFTVTVRERETGRDRRRQRKRDGYFKFNV